VVSVAAASAAAVVDSEAVVLPVVGNGEIENVAG